MSKAGSGNGIMWGAVAVWLIGFLLGLGLIGTMIWAVVRLVLHFT